jgi:Dirigent-like protein
MRRLPVFVAVVLCVLASAIGVAWAASGLSGPEDITVVAKPNQFNYVDNHPKNDSLGDIFAFSGPVYGSGNVVGFLDGTCILTHKNRHGGDRNLCSFTVGLSGGEVQTQGSVRFVNGLNRFDVPVTGGSGRFQNAGGYAHVEDLKNHRDSRIVLHLIVP